MLGSPCFQHPKGIGITKIWTHRTLDVQIVISQLRNTKGWTAIDDCIFPLEDPKFESTLVFKFQKQPLSTQTLSPDPALLLILVGTGWLIVSLDLWFSLHFMVSGCVCKLSKSIYDLTRLARQAHTHTDTNEGLLEKDELFYRMTVVLIKST